MTGWRAITRAVRRPPYWLGVALATLVWVASCDPAGADVFSYQFQLVGPLSYGQTSAPVNYHNPPRFRAFKFVGEKGDAMAVWVHSPSGDPVVWVLDIAFRILAYNDDATASTVDAHVSRTLPGNTNPADKTYYIVFRDYHLEDASFTVTLSRGFRLPPLRYLSPRVKLRPAPGPVHP